MRRFIACILTSIVVNGSALAQSDAKQRLQDKLSTLNSFTANFNQTVVDGLGEALQTAEGNIYLQQPNLMHWQSLPPNELTLVADGAAVWYLDPFAEQVIAMDQSEAASNHPMMLLADESSPQWSLYSVTESNSDQYVLTSISEETDFVSMTVTFEQGLMNSVSILDRMEQTNKLTFKDIKQNIKIDSSLFQFQLPEGFDLDDQRSQSLTEVSPEQ